MPVGLPAPQNGTGRARAVEPVPSPGEGCLRNVCGGSGAGPSRNGVRAGRPLSLGRQEEARHLQLPGEIELPRKGGGSGASGGGWQRDLVTREGRPPLCARGERCRVKPSPPSPKLLFSSAGGPGSVEVERMRTFTLTTCRVSEVQVRCGSPQSGDAGRPVLATVAEAADPLPSPTRPHPHACTLSPGWEQHLGLGRPPPLG